MDQAARGSRARRPHAHVLAAAGVHPPRLQPVPEGRGLRPRDRARLRRAHGHHPAGHPHQRHRLAAGRQEHGRPHHRPLRADRGRRRRRRGHLRPAVGRGDEPRHRRLLLPHDRGPELHPRHAAAVRADLGARAAERPQHGQRAALDRRPRALSRRQRLPPCRARAQPARAQRGAAQRAADVRVPGLERPRAQRQAHRPPGPHAVRRPSERCSWRSTRSARRSTSRTSSTPSPPATA